MSTRLSFFGHYIDLRTQLPGPDGCLMRGSGSAFASLNALTASPAAMFRSVATDSDTSKHGPPGLRGIAISCNGVRQDVKCEGQIMLFKKGSKGPPVKVIQQALKKVAKAKIKDDGIFGPKTDKAVREFQTGAKLSVDGIVGPKTTKALKLKPKDLKDKGEVAPKTKPISISYTVPKLKQPTSMSCWATGIAMMVSWKKHMSIAPETIADVLGYTKQFKSGGLHPEDTKVFSAWGMKWEPPMCYSVQGFADLMRRHGPMWVAGNPKAPHVRVLIAMKGDGTPEKTIFTINDPAGGRQYKQSFIKVMGNMEALGGSSIEMKMKKPIYIAHF